MTTRHREGSDWLQRDVPTGIPMPAAPQFPAPHYPSTGEPPADGRRPMPFECRSEFAGGIGTVVITPNDDATVTVTGRLFPPRALRGFRIRLWAFLLPTLVFLTSSIVLLGQSRQDRTPSALGLVLLAAGLFGLVGGVANRSGLHRIAEYTTLRVPVSQIRQAKASPNYAFLWLILFIGPFALIPLFVGRRYLRLELPFRLSSSEPPVRLHVREVRGGRGDAQTMATWLRTLVWAGQPSVPPPAAPGASTLQAWARLSGAAASPPRPRPWRGRP